MGEELYTYERELRADGYRIVCGVDEAGRGPLAGPVYAAAVILPADTYIEGLDDSKKLSDSRRRELSVLIRDRALAWAVRSASHSEIDEQNILNATFLAMKRAVEGLSMMPDLALVDGNRMPKLGVETQCIVKGDSKCACIAAASILAKVARDDYMLEMSRKYPDYAFEKHKGYPTKLHYRRIFEHGVSPIHRMSFLKNLEEHR